MKIHDYNEGRGDSYFYVSPNLRLIAEKKAAKTILKLGILLPEWVGFYRDLDEGLYESTSAMEHIEGSMPIWETHNVK